MIHTLKVTLKQHTPLIHFQHDQDGATLRASEVKPKLDRYILTQLGNGDYNEGKRQAKESGWLVGKGEHPSLDYKMRIVATSPQSIQMTKQNLGRVDEIGRPLYTTPAYPKRRSLIMGNMGGRIEEELLNFVLFSNTSLFISTTNEFLFKFFIKSNIEKKDVTLFCDFFSSHNFGNRTSKGFGSFFATHFNDIPYENTTVDSVAMLSFSLIPARGQDKIKMASAYEDIFLVIGSAWKGLKIFSHAPRNSMSSVLLKLKSIIEQERIPSPVLFKPYVKKSSNAWDVTIYVIPDYSVIDAVGIEDNDLYNLIENAINYFNDNITVLSPKTYNEINDLKIQ